MFQRALKKYRAEGLDGVRRALLRRVVPATPICHPVQVALDEVTKHEGFTIVQLGAYVGKTDNDPLYERVHTALRARRGTLVLVEPIKEFFDELLENYRGVPGVLFANVAVSNRSGPATFYRLGVKPEEHGFPEWLSQLGSLKEDRMGALWDRYEADPRCKEFYLRNRVAQTVECLTFAELVSRYGITTIDLLQIDVEGFEFDILSTVDFGSVPIRFVNYESVLLQERDASTERIMRGAGYRLVQFGQDTFCYRYADRRLEQVWRRRWFDRLRPSR